MRVNGEEIYFFMLSLFTGCYATNETTQVQVTSLV